MAESVSSSDSQAYIVFDSKALQNYSLAIVEGLPVLVLSGTKEQETYQTNVITDGLVAQTVNFENDRDDNQSSIILQKQIDSTVTSNQTVTLLKGERMYNCNADGCSKRFSSQSHLKEHHIVQHEGQRTLKCGIEGCNRTFFWPAHLRYHERTHLGEKEVKCPIGGCEKEFYTSQRLQVHMRTHTGDKPFSCSKCSKCFTTAGNLKNHVRTHTGERPFKCMETGCYRRFAEQSSLRKHMLVHTGDKPYVCNICGRVFTQAGSRNVHLKRHKDTDGEVHGKFDLSGIESVVFSNTSMDHVVTITTQPSEQETTGVEPHQSVTDELTTQERLDKIQVEAPVSASANVVVLSQPEEIVTMATRLHSEQETSEEIVYDNTVLHNEFDHEEIACNLSNQDFNVNAENHERSSLQSQDTNVNIFMVQTTFDNQDPKL